MTIKLDNSALHKIISETLGEEHLKVMRRLSQPKYDEDIAEELGLKATIVRTLLNDLHSKNLVEYERIKNKSTGWYTYIWRKREDKLVEYARLYLEKKLQKLTKELEKEEKGTFKCSCNVVSFSQALENDFFCPECGEKLVQYDNSQAVKELKTEIEKIRCWCEKI